MVAILVAVAAIAAAGQTKVVVRFPKDQTQTTVRGAVRTNRYIDYIVTARVNQIMDVKVEAANPGLNFVVYVPKKEIPDGGNGVRGWNGTIPATGEYTIRVILPRNGGTETSASFAATFTVR